MTYEIVEKLKREIAVYNDDTKFESVGFVVEAADGIARISGLRKALSQELLAIETKAGVVPAIAFNLEEEFIGAVLLGESASVGAGDRVKGTGKVLSIQVGDELLGRIVSPLGEPEDGKGPIFNLEPKVPSGTLGSKSVFYTLERPSPGVLEREHVATPLHTGIKAVDSMIPIGRGQRELIIGDRGTGKTAVALDTILN